MKTRQTAPEPLPASDLFGWFWSTTHREWNLRKKHNSPSRATVFPNGVWHTWDHNGTGGENSSCETVEEAKREAAFSADTQGFLCEPNCNYPSTGRHNET